MVPSYRRGKCKLFWKVKEVIVQFKTSWDVSSIFPKQKGEKIIIMKWLGRRKKQQ